MSITGGVKDNIIGSGDLSVDLGKITEQETGQGIDKIATYHFSEYHWSNGYNEIIGNGRSNRHYLGDNGNNIVEKNGDSHVVLGLVTISRTG